MEWPERITEKQRRFIMAIVGSARGNATQAAKDAEYSDASYGRELRTKPHIIETIEAYRQYLIQTGEYRVIDPIRVHHEWIDILEDPETSRAEKIQLLRDVARSNAMFTDKVEHSGHVGGQIVIIGGNIDEKEWERKASSYMEGMLRLVAEMKEGANEDSKPMHSKA